MDYSTFKSLIAGGEKATVDFKILSDALTGNTSHNGEFAKDICAMCNNGNVKSYILVGVSDDAKNFRSVTNAKLTDDNLQSFCKKAIVPPPRVNLSRQTWPFATPQHKGVEFVIVAIGPQPRQAFCLGQDFIDFGNRFCVRRNEVWIRRGATSDLATPQEIARLVKGQAPEEETSEETRASRKAFCQASEKGRCGLVDQQTQEALPKEGYGLLSKEETFKAWNTHAFAGRYLAPAYCRQVGSTILLLHGLKCISTLTQGMLERFNSYGFLRDDFVVWMELPSGITQLTRRRVHAVRRICVRPVLARVPPKRVHKVFREAVKHGANQHYYLPNLSVPERSGLPASDLVPSSSELIVIDGITSVVEYRMDLERALASAEGAEGVVVDPG